MLKYYENGKLFGESQDTPDCFGHAMDNLPTEEYRNTSGMYRPADIAEYDALQGHLAMIAAVIRSW